MVLKEWARGGGVLLERKSCEGISCRSSICLRISELKNLFLSTAFNRKMGRVFLASVEFLVPHSFQCYELGLVDVIYNPHLTEEIKEDQDNSAAEVKPSALRRTMITNVHIRRRRDSIHFEQFV